MSFFDRLKSSLQKTKDQLFGAFDATDDSARATAGVATGTATRRIESLDALEEALITCDVGVAATDRIVEAVRRKTKRGDDLLPLVRRTFSRFEPGERRQVGTLVSTGGLAPRSVDDADVDLERGAPAMAKMAELLGLELQSLELDASEVVS